MASQRLLPSLVVLSLVLAVPSGGAQGADLFVAFEFDDLEFKFHPEGLEKTEASDPEGSALTIHVRDVVVEGDNAIDLRYCMDGQTDSGSFHDCQYPVSGGNRDGSVDADEVAAFENLATSLALAIPEVKELTHLVKNNITVDGKVSPNNPKVTSIRFEQAEGEIDSDATILAFVDVKALYENDAGADRHEIAARDLDLREKGFVYQDVLWTVESDGWVYMPADTQPDDLGSKVNQGGWFSSQDVFENATEQGFTLVVAKEAGAGGKSSGPAPVWIIGAVAAAAVAAALVGVAVRRMRR